MGFKLNIYLSALVIPEIKSSLLGTDFYILQSIIILYPKILESIDYAKSPIFLRHSRGSKLCKRKGKQLPTSKVM